MQPLFSPGSIGSSCVLHAVPPLRDYLHRFEGSRQAGRGLCLARALPVGVHLFGRLVYANGTIWPGEGSRTPPIRRVCVRSSHAGGGRQVTDRKLILVADDDQSIRSLLQNFLEDEGFRTVEAKAGRDVIPAINKHLPDVVLMDVRMPGMSGLEVLDQMQRLHITIPVLMMTAYGTSNVAIEAIQRGAYDYVTKPFDIDDLLLTLRRTLDHRDLALKARAVDDSIPDPLNSIIGNTTPMQHVYKTIGRVGTRNGCDHPRYR